MRWFSTVESADNLEFSVLAAVESLAAVSLSLWLAWHFQTATHILIAACLAPFLLLRTEESTERGLRWFEWWWSFQRNKYVTIIIMIIGGVGSIGVIAPFGTTGALTIVVGIGIGGIIGLGEFIVFPSFACKFIATIRSFASSPLDSLRNMPINWFRVTFCVDTLHLPELLPGIERYQPLAIFRLGTWLNTLIAGLHNTGWGNKITFGLLLFFTPIVFLPAIVYRWSLKSSSIIWLPLIWVIGWKHETAETANQQLQIDLDVMRYTARAKLMMAYSLFVIVVMTGLPLILKGEAIHLKETLNPAAVNPMINNLIDYFLAFQMQAWHWSRLGASVLTLMLFFYSDKLLRERLYRPQAGLGFAPPFIRFVTLVRVPLSLFTIACGLYLLANPIDWTEMWRNMQWLPFEWGEVRSDSPNQAAQLRQVLYNNGSLHMHPNPV